MKARDPRTIIHSFYEEIWNKHDKSRIPALIHDGFSFRGSLGQEMRGHTDFASYVDSIHRALGNYHCEIQEIISEDVKAFARMRFSGVHRAAFLGYEPTGKLIEWIGAAVFTLESKKISSLWVLGDLQGLVRRLETNRELFQAASERG